MNDELARVVLEMVQACPVSKKRIADEVGKPYSTLMRELDPSDKGAKLGIELLVPLMAICESIAPLRCMAGQLGYRIASMKEITPDKGTFHEELLDTYQALVEYHRAMMEGRSPEIVAELREVLIRQLKEDFVAYLESRGRQGATGA